MRHPGLDEVLEENALTNYNTAFHELRLYNEHLC